MVPSTVRAMLLVTFVALMLLVDPAWGFRPAASFRWVQRSSSLPSSLTELSAKTKYKVTIQHEGKEVTVDCAEDCSVLSAAKDAGVELPYDCELGVCLTCPAKVVSGKVDHSGSTLEDSVAAQGYALTCCTYPRSDMVIKSIDEDELVSAQFAR